MHFPLLTPDLQGREGACSVRPWASVSSAYTNVVLSLDYNIGWLWKQFSSSSDIAHTFSRLPANEGYSWLHMCLLGCCEQCP